MQFFFTLALHASATLSLALAAPQLVTSPPTNGNSPTGQVEGEDRNSVSLVPTVSAVPAQNGAIPGAQAVAGNQVPPVGQTSAPPVQNQPLSVGAAAGTCNNDPRYQVTKENWISQGVDGFIRSHLAECRQNKLHFTNSLVQKYAPGTPSFGCSPIHQCSPITCPTIKHDEPNAVQAYHTLAGVSHLNSLHMIFLKGLQDAKGMLTGFSAGFLQTFSVTTVPAEFDPTWTQWIFTFLAATYGFIVPFAPNEIFSKSGVQAGHASAFVNIYMQTKAQGWQPLADFGGFVTILYSLAQSRLSHDSQLLLAGNPDATGNSIDAYLADGALATVPSDLGDKITKFVNNQMAALAINSIWRYTHVYIVASPLKDGEICEDDKRGPKETRYCMEGDRTVYYAYQILDGPGTSTIPWESVRTPMGINMMNTFGQQLSFEMFMESSILAFYYDPTLKTDWLAELPVLRGRIFRDPRNNPIVQGSMTILPGTFNVPVCYDSTGTQQVPSSKIWDRHTSLTDLETKFGAHFPCRCGPNGRDSAQFAARTRLDKTKKYAGWELPVIGTVGGWCRIRPAGPAPNNNDQDIVVPDVWKQKLATFAAEDDTFASTLMKDFNTEENLETKMQLDMRNNWTPRKDTTGTTNQILSPQIAE